MLSYLFSTTSLNYLYTATNFVGTFRHDVVFSSYRNDTISTGGGNDWVDSGAGNDVISLGDGDDFAYAGDGDDSVDGGTGNDFIDGGNGNDSLRGGGGNDVINAGRGNDRVIYRADAGAGIDTVNGGQGTDTLVLELTAAQQANAAVIADLAAFNAYLATGGNGVFQFKSIGLRVTGGFENVSVVTVTGTGGPTNTAPVVSGPVALSGGVEDTTLLISAATLLANATDAEGNPLSVVNLQASSGTLMNNGNNTYTYTPVANANGPVSFTYGVSDGLLTTAATATLNVAAVNDGPVAGAAVVLPAAAEDSAITITAAQLLANASDVDNATLSVVNLQASSGSLVNNNNGTYSFTPAANDDTGVTFTYQISDGALSVAGSASLDLTPVNDGPVAGAAIVLPAADEDSAITITAAQLLANASDVDNATLSVVNLQASSGSLVNNNDGTYSFSPAANDDTGVTFTYLISDGAASVAGSASLDLTPVNDLPVAGASVVLPAVLEDNAVTITTAQLLANVTDVDSTSFTVSNLQASSGALVDLGGGSYSFTPDANDDTAVTFSYLISDGQASVVGSASLDLTPVNDAPVAGAAIVLADLAEDNTVTITTAQLVANVTDVDNSSFTVSNLQASSGSLVDNGDGTFDFTPVLNDDSAVSFTYQVSDGALSVASSAALDLTPVNDLPVFNANSHLDIAITSTLPFGLGVVTATDVETPAANLTYSIYLEGDVQPLGEVGIDAVTGEYFYLQPQGEFPEGYFTGPDNFQVKVTDADGGFTITTVTVNSLLDGSTNYVDANSNRGGMLGTWLATDEFHFENNVAAEISSGVDYLDYFFTGEDVIYLHGDAYAAVDIIAGATIDVATGGYRYEISATGAAIISNTQLAVEDFVFDVFPS